MLLSLLAALAVLGWLLVGGEGGAVVLPVGPFGQGMRLAFNALTGFFLLVVLLEGAAGILVRPGWRGMVGLAGAVLAVVAGDGFVVLIGLGATLAGPGRRRRGIALAGIAVAMALASGGAPDGDRAGAAMALGLAAASGLGGGLGAYLMVRIVGDLGGMAPAAWSLLPLLGGAGLTAWGALAAGRARRLGGVAEGITAMLGGLVLLGAGLGAAGRAADLMLPAAIGLQAALLAATGLAVVAPIFRLADALLGAPSTLRPGGLRLPPVLCGCLLTGVLAGGLMPPGLGFVAVWTALKALLIAPAPLPVIGQAALAAAIGGLAIAVVLAAAAAARVARALALGGLAPTEGLARFLPVAIAGFALLAGVAGLYPGAVIWLGRDSLIGLTGIAVSGVAGYSAWAVAAILLATGLGARLLVQRRHAAGARLVPAWMDGAPPIAATDPPARRLLPPRLLRHWRGLRRLAARPIAWPDTTQAWLAPLLAVLAGLLLFATGAGP